MRYFFIVMIIIRYFAISESSLWNKGFNKLIKFISPSSWNFILHTRTFLFSFGTRNKDCLIFFQQIGTTFFGLMFLSWKPLNQFLSLLRQFRQRLQSQQNYIGVFIFTEHCIIKVLSILTIYRYKRFICKISSRAISFRFKLI